MAADRRGLMVAVRDGGAAACAVAWTLEVTATDAEWRAMLRAALQPYPCRWDVAQHCEVALGDGSVYLAWSTLPQRVIASLRLPRLRVTVRAVGVEDADWIGFQRRLALYTQRGGG